MKLRIKNMLLFPLLAAGAYQAEAARNNKALVVGHRNSMEEDAVLIIGTDQTGMNSSIGLKPYVKDGAGTASVTGSDTMKSAFYVREGGSVNLQEVYMGHFANTADAETVTLNIDEEPAFTAASLQMDNGAVVTNKGVMQIAGALTVNGGKLVNTGVINGVVSFAAGDGADIITSIGGEVVNSGTIASAFEMSGGISPRRSKQSAPIGS